MTIGPLFSGRLPNSFAAQRLTQSIRDTRVSVQQLQDQLTTGQQYQVGSEDPGSALRTVALQHQLERNQQYQTNIQRDQSLLSATESSLSSVTDAINQARSLVLQGIGDTVSDSVRQSLAVEAGALARQVVNSGNTKFGDRYLFGGSQTDAPPFAPGDNGFVRYSGDRLSVDSFLDFNLRVANNIDGDTAFNALTNVESGDLNVALTLDTRLRALHGGEGIQSGTISISLQDGPTTESRSVDLTGAETVRDLKTRIEDAFATSAITITVEVDPTTDSGLRLTPSSGTVAVSNGSGTQLADDLGITSSAVAQVNGTDLDPRLSFQSRIADLNGGNGIGTTAGNGLLISNGSQSDVIDLSGLDTLEDLFNALRNSGLDLDGGISQSGQGIEVISRISGGRLSIGENNGDNATQLGLRTLTGDTPLSELNLGVGTQVASGELLEITRRDGSTASLDLSAANTVQDVLDVINAADPGNLVASLAAVGNGIALTDNSGSGPLTVADNSVSNSLGLAGTESGSDPAVALTGDDVNQLESTGIISILSNLEAALRTGDDRTLQRLSTQLDVEADRFLQVQAGLGTRLRTLDEVQNRLLDDEVNLNGNLSQEFDADLTEVLSALVAQQQTLEATYRIASQTLQLSLLSFI